MVIPQSVYWSRNDGSDDMTWDIVEPTIFGQIAMNLAILTACVPSLKGVIDMYLSGASVFTVPGQYTSSNNDSGVNGIRSLLPSRFGRYKTGSQTQNKGSNVILGSQDTKNASQLRSQGLIETRAIPERSESQISLRENDNNIIRTVEYEIYSDAVTPRLTNKATASESESSLDNELTSRRGMTRM